jgi:predicted transcriptional regulator
MEAHMATSNTMTIRLNSAIKKKLDRLARATGRTKSYLAAEAIETYVENEAWQIAAIKEGIKAADEGRFASDEEVRAAFAKWGVNIEK